MTLYYAIGGGLGHLTRARTVLHTLGISQATIITASQEALDPRINGGFDVRVVPSELSADSTIYRAWLHETIGVIKPTAVIIDTFPVGILGEFRDTTLSNGIDLIYIARLLRWNEYAKLLNGTLPCFNTTYCVEQLTSEHEAFIQSHSLQATSLELMDPPTEAIDVEAILDRMYTDNRPLWLVVHSGPVEEVEELAAYAQDRALLEATDPHIVVISPCVIPDIPCFDIYPAHVLFPYADRIITACGFNVMRQLLPWREKHWFVPMPRRYDDQFLRAARAQGGIEISATHSAR